MRISDWSSDVCSSDLRLLTRLDYAEAQEIATTGAKVLHPRSIKPCRDAGVPLAILDTEHPERPGTSIDGKGETVPGVKAVSRRNGIVLVSMESVGMWQQVGFLAELFELFRRHGLSVDLIGSSETTSPCLSIQARTWSQQEARRVGKEWVK